MAAPAQPKPLNEWLELARPVNPGVPDQELTAFYEHKYGQPDTSSPSPELPTLDHWLRQAKPVNPDVPEPELKAYWQEKYGSKGARETEPTGSDIVRGATVAAKQIPQLAYGLEAGAGAVGEKVFGEGGLSTAVKEHGVAGYERKSQEIAATSKDTDSATVAWERAKAGDFGALADFLQYGMGYAGTQAVEMLATAGLGSLAGKMALKPLATVAASKMVSKEAAALAGTEVAKGLAEAEIRKLAVANVASRIGQTVALGATATGMEGGEIFGGLTEQAKREGRDLSGAELGKAFGASLAAGALEFVGDKFGLDLMLGKSAVGKVAAGMPGVTGRLTRGAIAAAADIPIEAGTEYAQTLLEVAGQGKDPFSAEATREAIDSAALGGVGGAVVGGASGVIRGPQPTAGQPSDQQDPIRQIVTAPDVDQAIDQAAKVLDTKAEVTPEALDRVIESQKTPELPQELQTAPSAPAGTAQPEIVQPAKAQAVAGSLPVETSGTVEPGSQRQTETPVRPSPEPPTGRKPIHSRTVDEIHALADAKGISWDEDNDFMDFTESITGKRALDDLVGPERNRLYAALEQRPPQPMPSQPGASPELESVPASLPPEQRPVTTSAPAPGAAIEYASVPSKADRLAATKAKLEALREKARAVRAQQQTDSPEQVAAARSQVLQDYLAKRPPAMRPYFEGKANGFEPEAMVQMGDALVPVRIREWLDKDSAFVETPVRDVMTITGLKAKMQPLPGLKTLPKYQAPVEPEETSPAITQPRSVLPPEQNQNLVDRAQAASELVGQGQAGSRVFIDNPNGPGQTVVSVPSTYPKFYGPLKMPKAKVLEALEKIIKDRGLDVGPTVEKVKAAILADGDLDKIVGEFPEEEQPYVRQQMALYGEPETEKPAPAVFVGVQKGHGIRQDFELYNLTEDIPGHPKGSTVSRQTIEQAGYVLPARPKAKPEQASLPMDAPVEVGQKPIIGREATREEAPLFSKAAQTSEPEQTLLSTPESKQPAAPKEPWQMTALEYTQSKVPQAIRASENMKAQHRVEIKAALKRGDVVPAEVLADYPDLKPAESPAATIATALRTAADAIEQAGKPKTAPDTVAQPEVSYGRAPQTETASFRAWFKDSKVVDENGDPLVVYHGAKRPDRIGDRFRKSRATSGPMAFFTDDPAIASKYATGKQDTSMALENRPYETWFKVKVQESRSLVDLDRAWYFLSPEQRQKIADMAPRITKTDDGEQIILGPETEHRGIGGYDQHIKEARGNHLKALVEEWLNSGALFNDEEEFFTVLKLAGMDMATVSYDDPHAELPGVYPVYLSIQRPLVTSNIPDEVVASLEEAAKRRRAKAQIGADPWDKNLRDPKDWVAELKKDRAEGKNSFVWSSIPDFVTEVLKAKGYDGIHDMGGKMGGVGHDVWIPFEETQVKSATGNRGTFDPTSRSIVKQPELSYGEPAPIFYSQAQRVIEQKMPNKASMGQVRAILSPINGVKPDEIKWTGLDDYLKTKDTFTKQEVLDYLKANQVQVQEVVKGKLPLDEGAFFDRHNLQIRRLHDLGWDATMDPGNPQHLGFIAVDESGDIVEAEDVGERTSDERILALQLAAAAEQGERDTTKFSQYQLPGGTNYRELLLTLPEKPSEEMVYPEPLTALPDGYELIIDRTQATSRQWGVIRPGQAHARPLAGQHPTQDAAIREAIEVINQERNVVAANAWRQRNEGKSFTSPHFSEPNILVHVRFNDRMVDGKKVLFLEEIQSDWHQKGRREGYSDSDRLAQVRAEIARLRQIEDWTPELEKQETALIAEREKLESRGVPDAPLKKTWHELALRRMLRYAAEHGYDTLAWTTGEQQNERYDLSKQVDEITWYDPRGKVTSAVGVREVTIDIKSDRIASVGVAVDESGTVVASTESDLKGKPLSEVVGKDVAEKIMESDHGSLSGEGLKIGGSGMKGFYDEIIPAYLSKYGKKWGATVGTVQIDAGKVRGGYDRMYEDSPGEMTPVHSLDITDSMRQSVLTDGQILFQKQAPYALRPGEPDSDRQLSLLALGDLDRTGVSTAGGTLVSEGAGGVRTLGLGFTPELIRTERIDLRGQTVTSAADVAQLAQVYRDPRFETFRVIYTKGEEIVAHEGISSRLPGSTKVFTTPNAARGFFEMKTRMHRLGADGYYLLHNHPSGNPTPSREDLLATKAFAGRVPGFKGHVVIDSGRYAVIQTDGTMRTFPLELPDPLLSPSIPHDLLNEPITKPDDLAQLAKRMQTPEGFVTLLYVTANKDGKSAVRAIQEVPEALFRRDEMADYLRGRQRVFGSDLVFSYSPTTDQGMLESARELMRQGYLRDHAMGSGEAARTAFDNAELKNLFTRGRGKRQDRQLQAAAVRVEEPSLPYGSTDDIGLTYGNEPPKRQQTLYPKPKPDYTVSQPSSMDKVIRLIQDKHIDLRRLVDAIKSTGKTLADELNPVYKEEMYAGRAAQASKDFLTDELEPLVQAMRLQKVNQVDLNEYLHARHAKEANAYLRKINPDMPQNEALSGMTDEKAEQILKAAEKRPELARIAKRVDAIIQKTRQQMVEYGLESKEVIDKVGNFYKHYVPLDRAGLDDITLPEGQGLSVMGSKIKRRLGSRQEAPNILAHIAMARENTIARGEKLRPVVAMAGLLMAHPNKEIAYLDKPATITVVNPLTGLEETVPGDLGDYKIPRIRAFDEETGTVRWMPDPQYKTRDNVVNFRVQGQDYAIVFNEQNDRAMEIAKAFKDIDTAQLNGLMAAVAPVTRYIASVNTQYNPIFGLVNFVRDIQFAMVALGNTPLKGKRNEIRRYTFQAMAGIYADARAIRRGEHATSATAQLWERFEKVGGPTGYRDLFSTPEDRAKAIDHLLDPNWWQKTLAGRAVTANGLLEKPTALIYQKGLKVMLEWLSDYNQTMENSVRLGVFKAGLEAGMSDIAAASIAKNITVNFNRKGQISSQMGSLYAFFNANVQGTARMFETLFEPGKFGVLSGMGKRVIAGGVTLGVLQAFLLAMAGFDEDDPPEWLRARSIIIPVPGTDKGYVSWPMPLGFNFIPNLGRTMAETLIFGKPVTRFYNLLSAAAEAFYPLGGAGLSVQTIAPTAVDPLVALAENRDWTGRRIYREDVNSLKPTPGFTRTRDSASPWAKTLSEIINYATGGNAYRPGAFSPTPDAIDYLVKQATGGIGRETTNLTQTVTGLASGEEVPFYKVPVLGRFAGSATGVSSVRNRFYANLRELNLAEAELKGRREDGEETTSYRKEHPEVGLVHLGNLMEREVSRLNKRKRDLLEKGASREQVKLVELQIAQRMQRLNDRVAAARERGVELAAR